MKRLYDKLTPPLPKTECKCCLNEAVLYDLCDFGKAGSLNSVCGVAIYYYRCPSCGFIFTTAFDSLSDEDMAEFIYNKDYIIFDPDYSSKRPLANVQTVTQTLKVPPHLRILDYGCGGGILVSKLREMGYQNVQGYDPFSEHYRVKPSDKYELVMSFEVVEHMREIFENQKEIFNFLEDGAVFLFSTLLQPDNIQELKCQWWYISPRTGHTSIHSRNSLSNLIQRVDPSYKVASFSNGLHLAFNADKIPDFAKPWFGSS